MKALAAGVALVVVVVAAAGWFRWQDRPPYGPAELGARATLGFVDQRAADAALAPVATMYGSVTAPLDASPVTLQTVLLRPEPDRPPSSDAATAPVAIGDLKVMLVSVGSGGRVHWATQASRRSLGRRMTTLVAGDTPGRAEFRRWPT